MGEGGKGHDSKRWDEEAGPCQMTSKVWWEESNLARARHGLRSIILMLYTVDVVTD